ncbi:MAG TPA: hypothetical protein VMM35_00185 [Longimicrobiales bacterium]|nr:hypothetical protein [Longimicrobiales bacterium]
MCRASVGAAGMVLAALFTTAPALAAQEAPSRPTEEELVRRLESLTPVLEEAFTADTAAARRRRLEEAERPRDVTELVRVGPLDILALPEQAELAAGLFEEVWRETFEGVMGSPALAEHVFVFRWAWTRAEPLRVDPAATGHAEVRRVELTRAWARTRAAATRSIRNAIWAVLQKDFPEESPLREWTGTQRLPTAERISRLVTLTPSDVNRACLAGDDGACLAALGLSGGEMTVPPEAPVMVLMEAIRLGGPGAWERLLERVDAEPTEALVHAAGIDAPAVAAAWRATLLAQRPEIHAGLGGQAARTLLWVLALAALAMRSTRWRIA